jgi:hypothetical protein
MITRDANEEDEILPQKKEMASILQIDYELNHLLELEWQDQYEAKIEKGVIKKIEGE